MSHFSEATGSTLGCALLITGCCVGAGMLGLPVITATAGLIPTAVAMLLCCLFMATTALLLLEATLWFGSKASLISMAQATLGRYGSALTWFLFLFLFYGLGIAYTAGCSQLVGVALTNLWDIPAPYTFSSIFSVLAIGCLVYAGTSSVDYLNRVLMLGLIATYFCLIIIGSVHVQPEQLLYRSWPATFATVPILLISFGFHNMIPSLTHYVRYDVAKMRLAILSGSLGAFAIYTIWECVILGLLPPPEAMSLEAILNQGDMVTHYLHLSTGAAWILPVINAFAFCAISTSWLANSLSFVDFLADGLHMSAQGVRRILLCALVLLPPLAIALITPHLFLKALHFAGGTAAVILFGIMPALIVWVGRYRQHRTAHVIVPGGRASLLGIIGIATLVLLLELSMQLP